jgi:hypothetical protein
MPKGYQSNGFTTDRGRLTIIGAKTSNGSRFFTPVLPGIGSHADWDAHLARIQASLAPGNYPEEQLADKVALTLQQWHRLDRDERATLVRSMEKGEDILHPIDDAALAWRNIASTISPRSIAMIGQADVPSRRSRQMRHAEMKKFKQALL